MIMGQSGPYLAKTTHDHDRRPECLNVKFRHNGWHRATGPPQALYRSRPPFGPCASATPARIEDPDKQRSPESRHHGFLKFLALSESWYNGPIDQVTKARRMAVVVLRDWGVRRGG